MILQELLLTETVVTSLNRCCIAISQASVRPLFPFEELIDKVDTAILHEKDFCEDVRGLKSSPGSNVEVLSLR